MTGAQAALTLTQDDTMRECCHALAALSEVVEDVKP